MNFLQQGVNEYGLIVPGLGIEHFLDLYMDAKDEAAGLSGGRARSRDRYMSKVRRWSRATRTSTTILTRQIRCT